MTKLLSFTCNFRFNSVKTCALAQIKTENNTKNQNTEQHKYRVNYLINPKILSKTICDERCKINKGNEVHSLRINKTYTYVKNVKVSLVFICTFSRLHFSNTKNSIAKTGKNYTMVTFIKSKASNFKIRSFIRRTWASIKYTESGKLLHVFVIGRPASNKVFNLIKEESTKYQDVLMFDGSDEYKLV